MGLAAAISAALHAPIAGVFLARELVAEPHTSLADGTRRRGVGVRVGVRDLASQAGDR